MGELDEKLNSILSSPAEMEKLMGMAKTLSESLGINKSDEGSQKKTDAEDEKKSSAPGLDPKIMKLAGRIMAEYSSGKNDKTALLEAMKPYLRQERRQAVDRAGEIARLTHAARIALDELGGQDKHTGR